MDYQELTLQEEIRRCLHSHSKPVHPKNIRHWIEQDRKQRESFKPIQSLNYIKRVIRYMPDIETVMINGYYYRQLKQANQSTIKRIKLWLLTQLHQANLCVKGITKNISI